MGKEVAVICRSRKQLIANDTLTQKDGFYQFTKDVGFLVRGGPQPVIEGGSANGLVEWRTKDGWVLQELDEQS